VATRRSAGDYRPGAPGAPDGYVARVEPAPSDETLVLLRLSGEVSTKAKATRRYFVTRLLRNVRDAVASEGATATVERHYDRLFVALSDPAAAQAISRVFGLQSLSRAVRAPLQGLDELVGRGEALFREAVRDRRFAVRARLVGTRDGVPFRARDVEVALGERLRPLATRVDLTDPEVTASVEVHRGQVYFFTERMRGEAGLPLGTEDRAVALVSGGFDSAVAAWQMQRRGVALDYVFCNLGGFSHQLGTVRVMQELAQNWSYGTQPRLHAIDFDPVSRDLQAVADPRYWQVILKRLMLRAADAVAQQLGARAIITGEAVGQVSSQTLVNLQTISQATRLPILRPLVGMNKDEIVALAHRIGTGPLSAVVQEYCALVQRNPSTSARAELVDAEEARLDATLLDRAIANREILDLRRLDPEATGLPEIETDRVREGAQVIDLRSRGEFERWHYPGAVRLDFSQALQAYPSFSKDRHYLLTCPFGLQSAHLAELMRRDGFEALHFRGGSRALEALARRSGSGS
jgi:thiamine biosynthesis protein ThiI